MADVIAFKLEPRPPCAHLGQDMGNVARRVLEHQIIGAQQEGLLPIMLPLGDPRRHRVQREIHRAHVQAAHLGTKTLGRFQPCVQRHHRRAAGRHIHHRIAPSFDRRQEPGPMRGVRRGAAGVRMARMQMQDRRPGLSRPYGLGGNLGPRDRQIGRHRRGMDRPGDGARDDDLRHHANPSACKTCHTDRAPLSTISVNSPSVQL